MSTVKLGVIGPGLIFRNMHANILKQLQDVFEVSALCARTDKTLELAKELFPNATCFKNADELLEQDLDAVMIALPILDNGDMAIKALNKGKHVFIEKPLAHNSKLAHEIIELSRKTGKQVYCLENFAYKPICRKMAEVIKEGLIGTPVYCDARQHYVLDFEKNANDSYAFTPWRINPEFPLGCFLDGGVHYLSALTRMFGKPTSIYASGTKHRENYGDYDHILTVLEYGNTLRVNFSQSGILDGEKECIKVWGTDGFISLEQDYIKLVKNGETTQIPVTPVESHLAMWQYLADCTNGYKETLYNVEEAALAIDICEAITSSLKEHKSIAL